MDASWPSGRCRPFWPVQTILNMGNRIFINV